MQTDVDRVPLAHGQVLRVDDQVRWTTATTAMASHQDDNAFFLLWGAVTSSPLGYVWISGRILFAVLIATLLVIWDLVATIFSIIWNICTDWLFLLIVAVIFLVLFIIHKYWEGFVDFLNHHFIPILQLIIDDFILFVWNDLFVPLWNIFATLWDALVQIIGFLIYFSLSMFITFVQIFVNIITQVDIGQLFQDLMEVRMIHFISDFQSLTVTFRS